MRIFMLGWEFPPYISGGLGTACYGLTRALNKKAVHVSFVLPHASESAATARLTVHTPQGPAAIPAMSVPEAPSQPTAAATPTPAPVEANISFHIVPAGFAQPYTASSTPVGRQEDFPRPMGVLEAEAERHAQAAQPDFVEQTQRYAEQCVEIARGEQFDLIHAHDWMSFPAAIAIARQTGKPFVAHVHSTEHDRVASQPNPAICRIEQQGLEAADRVIAVSRYTRTVIERHYRIPAERITVIHNGIDPESHAPPATIDRQVAPHERVVLFLGRLARQKGPEYFIQAAQRVLEHRDDVKFIVAGAGELAGQAIEQVAASGLAGRVLFTGFLDSHDVARAFRMADVYVMPSVSEPFGLAALEAIRHDVPVIVSRHSGVVEVVRHALKVDFWDTDDIADKILAVLNHPPLADNLRRNAQAETRRLTWDHAAEQAMELYNQLAPDPLPA